jgi:hypothetical protein
MLDAGLLLIGQNKNNTVTELLVRFQLGAWSHLGKTSSKTPGKAALLQACSLEH